MNVSLLSEEYTLAPARVLFEERQGADLVSGAPSRDLNKLFKTANELLKTIYKIDSAQPISELGKESLRENLRKIEKIRTCFFAQARHEQTYNNLCEHLLTQLKVKLSGDMTILYTNLAQTTVGIERDRYEFNAIGWKNPSNQVVVSHLNKALGHTKLANAAPCSFLLRESALEFSQ